MPLTLNVGFSKKIGQPDYGSLGASCHVELELSSHTLDRNPDVFQQEVRGAFAACRQAVEAELAHQLPTSPDSSSRRELRHATTIRETATSRRQPVTPKQLDYARRLAAQIENLGPQGLDGLAHQLYARPFEELTSFEASSLIDTLRQIKAGQLGLAKVLEREAA